MSRGGVRFDVIVMVDWSAASAPTTGRDSIWIACADTASGRTEVRNHRTRVLAREAITETLIAAMDQRVLVGFDFPFGYPAGTSRALLGASASSSTSASIKLASAVSTMWSHLELAIRDDERNLNNRFEVAAALNRSSGARSGPFWGCSRSVVVEGLSPTKDHRFPVMTRTGPVEELRSTERALRSRGLRPMSVWQLAYAGAVGGQALVGIPVVAALIRDPRMMSRCLLWPFETGLVSDPTLGRSDAIVFAEVWPGAFELDLGVHRVRDAAQVIGTTRVLAAADAAGDLDAMFAPRLDPVVACAVTEEEGWILGAAVSTARI